MHQPSPSDHQPHSPQLPPFGPPTGDPVRLPGDRAEHVDFAKWPPDDNLPGGGGGIPAQPLGGGGFSGGPIGPYDSDFKKGRFNPKLVLLAVLLAVGGVVMVVMAMKSEAAKMTLDQVATIKKNVYVLPKADRVTKWRELAQQTAEYELQQEALMQLGWEGDKTAIPLAIKALTQIDHRIRGIAAQVLAYFGTPDADAGKDALQKALLEADDSDRPQITWALVTLHDPRVFDKAMDLYRKGHLTKVQRLGGGPAFNPEDIARLVTLDALAGMAGDENESVRQLIANIISRNAAPKYTDTLIKLVRDPVIDVAREAATGLGKIADAKARGPLLEALSKADKDNRQKFLEALRDGIGGEGLVIALGSVTKDKAETTWHQNKQLFDMLRKIADPRQSNALVQYMGTKPHVHWETEAALRLAEVGDLRALPYLASRMRLDPLKVYSDTNDYERMQKRDDNARVVAARMLADLAVIHPEALPEIRAKAEDAVIFWLHDKPEPHANGLRFLAASASTKDIEALRKWANPNVGLPKEGQQPPLPREWEVAQSAMRYVGWLKDPKSWAVLEKGLSRRDKKVDVTMDSMMGGGLALLGMTLRAMNVGAADGFAQWGDPKIYPKLTKFIEEPMENEQGRIEACFALAWVASDENMNDIVKRVHEFKSKEPKKQFVRACYLEALLHRPVPGVSTGLVDMIDKESDVEVRHQVARAIGFGGFDDKVQAALFKKMEDVELRNDAALALILGGQIDTATKAVAMYSDYPKEALDELKDVYYRSFGYWSDEDFAKGRLYKWVDTAEAIARIRVKDTLQDWTRLRLQAQFDNLDFDNGPHSMTRVVLRYRIMEDAKKGDSNKKRAAIQTLKFMKEQGSLMALRDEQGETGQLANRAFFEFMNPKLVTENIPEGKEAKPGGGNVVAPK
ncbi:MAG TPA: HEAT repeat domain-containing protein [Polyangiaceae bacterium]|nr:HEAT repeat domain-containing protein [Polyangiaceae bacterium]